MNAVFHLPYPQERFSLTSTDTRMADDADNFVFACGYVVVGGTVYSADSETGKRTLLEAMLSSASQEVNGSFAAVSLIDSGKQVCLITDTVGSYPIYYTVTSSETDGPKLCVSTDPSSIVRQTQNKSFDCDTVADLLRFGYAIGRGTLFKHISEVSPATKLRIEIDPSNSDGLSIIEERYWRFTQTSEIETQEQFDLVAEELFERLRLRYARHVAQLELPLLIKLTAGCDSRVLLSMFYDFTNVKTATYGYLGQRDVAVAKSLARQLGISHSYARLTGTESVAEYTVGRARRALGLRALPYIGLGSVAVLNSLPQEPYCHIPGHTADVIAGSHIRPEHIQDLNIDGRCKLVMSTHSILEQAMKTSSEAIPTYLDSERTLEAVRGHMVNRQNDPTWAAMQCWDLEHRQHRFILSDAAMLRSNGPVLLPFWDLDFRHIFQRCSVELLLKQAAYKQFIAGYIAKRFGARIKIHWPYNRNSVGPLLQEALATGDLTSAIARATDVVRQKMRLQTTHWINRYNWSVDRSYIRKQCREAISNDPAIREVVTEAGAPLFEDHIPGHVVEVKALLDSWRKFLGS